MANIIYAVVQHPSNRTGSFNVLDPDTWIGGVVPGPNDVARFSGPEASYYYEWYYRNMYTTYGNRDASLHYYHRVKPTQFSNGPKKLYTSSVWNNEAINFNTFPNRNYHANSLNTYIERNSSNYEGYYKDSIQIQGQYGLSYWRRYARTFRMDGGKYGSSQTYSYTVEGVTLSETDVTTFNTRSLTAGQDLTIPNMTQRMVDLFTGSSLHHNQGGLYRIQGPHNGLGITNNTAEAQEFRYFTIIKDYTGSMSYANSQTPAWGTDTAMTQYDPSIYYRAIDHFFTSSNAELYRSVGTSSLLYPATTGPTITGSGYFYCKPGDMGTYINRQGISIANPGIVKINFENMQNAYYLKSCSIDESYGTWTTASFHDHDMEHIDLREPSESGYIPKEAIGDLSLHTNRIWTDGQIHRYELTGSQHWNVGRIEMCENNIFHIKDDAKITLHDLQDGTYYPAIDMVDRCSGDSDLIITDRVTIEVSSSRTTVPTETGIWARNAAYSVLISGSQNYSSSFAPSASSAGDISLPITNVQNVYGVGDYITIESTGSLRTYNAGDGQDYSLPYTSSTYQGGTVQEIINRYSGLKWNTSVSQRHFTSSIDQVDKFPISYPINEWTHKIENDEVVQIVSMSADDTYIAKMYGKTGYIHEDLGLFTHDQFVEEFGESVGNTYAGSKRVVLVDSNHKNFQKSDQLIINSSSFANVLHATSYNSQSRFYEFTSSNQPPLEDVFDIAEGPFSGSSIWTYNYSTYGNTDAYFSEHYLKHRLLITGSFRNGSTYWGSGSINNAYNPSRYYGASGSSNGYVALKLDPTMAYTWRNDQHKIYSTNYISGHYMIKDLMWDEGDITISGSLIRDGSGDPTSSIGYDAGNSVKIIIGKSPTVGPSAMNNTTETNTHLGYIYPHPYGMCIAYGGYYGYGRSGNNFETQMGLDPNFPYYTAGMGNTQGYPARYAPVSKSFAADSGFTDDYVDWTRISDNTGSFHIRLSIKGNVGESFLKIKDKEVSMEKFGCKFAPSRIGVGLIKYASVYSINVTQRYQLLLLDTTDTFVKENSIQESGLLYDHYPNQNTKFWATEVVDVMGHKNLLWDFDYNKKVGDIRPYTNAVCRTGTTAGTQMGYVTGNYYGDAPFRPRTGRSAVSFNQGQANDNYYTITDLGTSVEFDTIGMQFVHSSYQDEYYVTTANQMNNVRFEVCDDIGVAAPNWVTVRATQNDPRYYNGEGGIRFYTFASGSVSARYIKYHSRGGTRSSTLYYYSHMGVYNFSASCAPGTAPASSSIRHAFGGPTSSICRMEFASTKNWAVGDLVYFHIKQGANQMRNYYSYLGYNYYGTQLNSTWYNLKNEDTVNGVHPYHTIVAIDGNVVTLDRPLTRIHSWDRMMAIKYNRGKINFQSTTAASGSGYGTGMFRVDNYTGRNTLRMSNVTMRNGYLPGYNAQSNGLTYISDVGAIPNYTGYSSSPNAHVFIRNWITARFNFAHPTSLSIQDQVSFNVFSLHTPSNEDYSTFGVRKYVQNFNISSHYGNGAAGLYQFGPSSAKDRKITLHWANNSTSWQWPGGIDRTNYGSGYQNDGATIHLGEQITCPEMTIRNTNAANGNTYEDSPYYDMDNMMAQKRIRNDKNVHPSRTLGRQGVMNWSYATHTNYAYLDLPNAMNHHISPYGTYLYGGNQDVFRNKDFIYLGNRFTQFLLTTNDNPGEYELFQGGNNDLINTSNYQGWLIECTFDVKEQIDIRIDTDLTYKIPLVNKYGMGQNVSPEQGRFGQNIPLLMLKDDQFRIYDVDYLHSTTFEDVSKQKTFTLPPGRYYYQLRINKMYYMLPNVIMTLKNLYMRLVTADLSKVTIISNNFDVLELFKSKNVKRDTTGYQTPSAGSNAVLKQSSDLGGTTNYKFNKIKL